METAMKELEIPDTLRGQYVVLCLRALYGFTDAPLMFQLALIFYLKKETNAISPVFDDNFLHWFVTTDGTKHLALIMTAHVDDLRTTG
eukprot:4916531-Pyramimonas_sp.AAC.1